MGLSGVCVEQTATVWITETRTKVFKPLFRTYLKLKLTDRGYFQAIAEQLFSNVIATLKFVLLFTYLT